MRVLPGPGAGLYHPHRRGDPRSPAGRGGERLWTPDARYQQEARVPLGLLAVWQPGSQESWGLGTTLERHPEGTRWTTQVYAWQMRRESIHLDSKSGLLLRHGGDAHRLTSLLHLHRTVFTLALAEWLAALVGWQALADLPAMAGTRDAARLEVEADPAPTPEAAGLPPSAADPACWGQPCRRPSSPIAAPSVRSAWAGTSCKRYP